MEKTLLKELLGLVSTIESAIRYLLSGAAVTAIYLLGLSNPRPMISWATQNPILTALIVLAVGSTVYTLYRLVFWIVGDGLAWWVHVSAPSLTGGGRRLWDQPYARFLKWRHSGELEDALSRYLYYRWAAVHFALIVGLSLVFALSCCETGSLICIWCLQASWVGVICLFSSVWQCSFLFRVERDLYQDYLDKSDQGASE